MVKAEASYIKTTVEARYWQLGKLDNSTTALWIVLHGQGQLPEYFIRKFVHICSPSTVIIAPEALHKYYLDGYNGKVGASWMTKEDRLTDIANYLTYLDNLLEQIGTQIELTKVKIHLLGFSQGTATASRWAVNGNLSFDHLVIWAGHFPPDLEQEQTQTILKTKEISIVYGKHDPYLTPAVLQNISDDLERFDLQAQLIEFDGAHEIDTDVLISLAD